MQIKEIIRGNNLKYGLFVIAFEPMKKSYIQLKKLKKNFPNKIKCFNVALSDRNGENEIYFQNQSSNWQVLKKILNI